MDIEAIRHLIETTPRCGGSSHAYAPAIQAAVGRYTRRRREEGASWKQIAAEVGVSATSIRSWAQPVEPGGFHQVVLVDEPPVVEATVAEEFVITSPLGFALTGCSLEQAVAVLRRLA